MIELNIEDYCQECPEFEACTDKLYAGNLSINIFVYCEHIHDHLLKKLKEQKNGKEEN